MDSYVENQPLLEGRRNNKVRKGVAIGLLVFVILTIITLISVFVYFHLENKRHKIDIRTIDEILEDYERQKEVVVNRTEVIIHPKPKPEPKPVEQQQFKPTDEIVKPSYELRKQVIEPKVPLIVEYTKVSYQDAVIQLKELFIRNRISVVPGSYEECDYGDCDVPGLFIYEWKIKMVAEHLSELPLVNVKEEFDILMEYEAHINIFGMYYDSEKKYKRSYILFKQNKKIVEEHNKNPDRLYNMKLNHFAGFSSDEDLVSDFSIKDPRGITDTYSAPVDLTDQIIHVDWRKKGYVSDIVHQRGCGSCWAVAATDVFNSFRAIKDKSLVKYSFQQLLDCVSKKYDCKRGGDHLTALNYIKNNDMCLYSEYQYIFKKIHCSQNMCRVPTKINEVISIKDVDALEHLKINGPFVTALNTNTRFVLYEDGIYDGDCEKGRGHSVVVVGHGYDKVKKVNYWIVKNSWGLYWGEYGYFRIVDTVMDKGRKVEKCKFLSRSNGLK